LYDREKIEIIAEKFELCPFELSLDLSLITDLIICDYNYVFDPLVKLKRYFIKPFEDYILLTDEAHNLPDRARDMYSALIDKEQILSVRREIKESFPEIAKKLNKINQILLDELKNLKDKNKQWDECEKLPDGLRRAIGLFLEEAGSGETNQIILDLTFELRRFYRISELAEKEHTILKKRVRKNGFELTVLNLDPSKLLNDCFKKCWSSIIFSATLIPSEYFTRILFNKKDTPFISLPSPFPEKNCQVIVRTDIDTRYKQRDSSIDPICRTIYETINAKAGNYITFFPSYSYMNKTKERFNELYPDHLIHIQENRMDETERAQFLNLFNNEENKTITAFAVMGGIFGEGIDLKGDKLIGTIIIGPGLPGLSTERDLYKKYYEQNGENGYDYAYRLPGFNRVLQAAGRVIRSENDKGVIILIDSRYGWNENKRLFPPYWKQIQYCRDTSNMKNKINNFWGNN